MKKISVLFVCMGNICRSPSAEGVFRHYLSTEGLHDTVIVDSAGTHAYHIGEAPDPRSQQFALQRNIDISNQKARRIHLDDFLNFDYIIAMDDSNKYILEYMLRKKVIRKPEREKNNAPQLNLFMDFVVGKEGMEIADPYYGENGFDCVLDQIEEASQALLTVIKRQHGI